MKKIVCLVTALFAPLIFLSAPNAKAEDSSLGLTGTCVPHTQDQGPWDCKVDKLIKIKCSVKADTEYDLIWKLVRNVDDGILLLKSVYLELGGPLKFSQWLACQGFSVYLSNPAAESPYSDQRVSVHINIGYLTRPNPPFPISWLSNIYYVWPYGADFEMYLDKFGQIIKIDHTYSNS